MKYAACSDVGKNRRINEDNYAIHINPNQDLIAVVADGIGGSRAGEIASRFAVDVIRDQFEKAPAFTHDYQVNEFIQQALNAANDKIYNASASDEKYKGMGTTCVGLIITSLGTYIFNVGDSRVYARYEDGLIQMSEDHSLINRLIKEGRIEADAPNIREQKNKLTNALGIWKVFRIDVNKIHSDYQQMLLCSDGLSGYVHKDQILGVLNSSCSVEDKAQHLVDLANAQGGLDNCTVVLLEHEEGD